MHIQRVGQVGPSLPLSLRGARERANIHQGKADPTWVTKFTTKFSKKPEADAPLATPRGAIEAFDRFLARASQPTRDEEIAFLLDTQDRELPTTLSELSANGLAGSSISDAASEEWAADIAATHLNTTPYAPDATYIATMSRRIEWERFRMSCGAVHRVRLLPTPQGVVINYNGPDAKTPELRTAHRDAFRVRWAELVGDIPSAEDLRNAQAYAKWYRKPILALMDEDQYREFQNSRRFGTEDPDPERDAFAGPPPMPRWAEYDTDSTSESSDPAFATLGEAEIFAFREDMAEWSARYGSRYAGPQGLLGIDVDALDAEAPVNDWEL